MSQAHYVICSHDECTVPAVAELTYPYSTLRVCTEHLNHILELADVDGMKFRKNGGPWFDAEPLALVWTWDAGTRTCPLHHWPDVVCRDWSAEHAAMIRALVGLSSTSTGG
jgi:hypothetical protein